ncbi:hypothetical protein Tco_1488427, partial [Tanacetum coccineum]
LYNNLKVYEPEVKGMSNSSSSTQNIAFMSSSNNNTSSTNEAVNIAHGVSTASTHVNAANSTYIDNLSDVDLSFTGLDKFVNKPVVDNCKAMSSEEEHKVVRKCDDASIIEDYVSDNEEEDVSQSKIEKKTVRTSIVKKEFVKSK